MSGSFWDTVWLCSGRSVDRNVGILFGDSGIAVLEGILNRRILTWRRRRIWSEKRKEDIGGLLGSEVGKIRTESGDHNIVFGESLGFAQLDANFFALFRLDGDHFFDLITMYTQKFDRNKVLAGRNGGDIDTLLSVGGIQLVDNTSARVIETVENNQH